MTFARYAPHVSATLALGLPLIGSHLARMAIHVSDTILVGWYGIEPLAGLIIATSYFNLMFFLGMGFGIGVMGVIAAAIQRGDEATVRRSARMALWLSVIYGILVMPLMWWSGPILELLGQEPIVAHHAQDFLRIAGFGLIPMLGALTLNSYLAAMEKPQVVMWVTLAGLPVNIFLNWVFLFGNLGAPELGVRGSGIATLSTQSLQFLLLILYARWLPSARRFHLFQRVWKPDWHAMRQVFKLGLPIGLTMVAEGGLFVASNLMMGWIGTQALAAHGIALQLTAISFMVHLGLSNAATIRAGQAKGRNDPVFMRDAGLVATALSMVFAAIAICVFVFFARPLVQLYLDTSHAEAGAIIDLAVYMMLFAALFQTTDALQVIALGLLRGVQDTQVPMIIAAISYWVVGLPTAYCLAFVFGFGPAGLWLGLVVGLSLAALFLLLRFWRGLARGHWTTAPAAG